jgi:formylglycine-generating enzyme required for sulfatase activity
VSDPLDESDPWVRTIALRLRSLYASPRASTDSLRPDLDARLASLVATRTESRYRALEPTATGGMGTVVRTHDARLHRDVARKFAARTSDPTEATRRRLRLLHEAEVLASLHHPGIVQVLDVDVDADGEPFFAMPWIEGRSLHQVLVADRTAGDHERSLRRCVEVLVRIADAMAFAHARGIVHRDLKPSNVMVGAYGEVVVVDWGLARRTGACDATANPDDTPAPLADPRLTATGSVLGTPSYMPPERANADTAGTTSPADDVYALGAMLYEVLTGSPPYASERDDWTVEAVLTAIRERPPRAVRELAPDADPELASVCARAMQRQARTRYRDMPSLAADLRAHLEHRVVLAHGGGVVAALQKWVRRNRSLAAALAAAAVVAVAGSAWFVDRLAATRDAASASLREVLDLAVVEQIDDLRRRADQDLWPLGERRGADLRAWLAEAASLRSVHERLRERQRAGAPAPDGASASEHQWRTRQLQSAVAALDAFFAPPADAPAVPLDATVAAVAMREGAARRIADATVRGEALASWQAVAARVRSSPHYAGLDLAPQAGLVPLGPDPNSGLEEFAHVQSGRAPLRGSAGTLPLDADSAIVLVLLPQGTLTMGAAPDHARQQDPLAETINESPVHDVPLEAFFVGKHEITQGQWQRLAGENPSVHTAKSLYVDDDKAPLHPVESIDWWTARRVLRCAGLALPTEAQWEYAARGGTTTPWYCGTTIESLLAPPSGNLADATSAEALGTQGWAPTPGLRDGYVMHAPIGSFPPNAFALHDVLGNVAEWCRDEYVSYATAPVEGTGARPLGARPGTVMYRGGAFDEPAPEARSANRAGGPPERRHFSLGVRAARAVAR